MVLPRLIHPVPITIQTLDRSATVMDDDLREAVQTEARATSVVCPGQVSWGKDESMSVRPEGVKEDSDGYVLFRFVDLRAKGITIKREDRFTKLGTVDVDIYVVSVQPLGHYPDLGGPGLVKAFFKDRQPGRQSKGV